MKLLHVNQKITQTRPKIETFDSQPLYDHVWVFQVIMTYDVPPPLLPFQKIAFCYVLLIESLLVSPTVIFWSCKKKRLHGISAFQT